MENQLALPQIRGLHRNLIYAGLKPQAKLRQFATVMTRRTFLTGISLYGLCFVVLGILIFAAPGFLGTDDYYHARMASQIIEQGRLRVDFPWLPQTILNPQSFVDHHLLYHVYVAPWIYWGGMAGAKLATVSIAAGVFVATWVLLRSIQVRFASLWTLVMFGVSTPFLYRMLMIRTQGASLLLLIVALTLLFHQRYRWMIAVAFAYTWLYNGFVLIGVLAGLYTAGMWLARRRFDLRPILYTSLGMLAGLVINPYFPQNIQFIIDHLGAKVNFDSGIQVGNEWYPYTTGALLQNSAGALLLFTLGMLHPSFNQRRRDTIDNTLLLVALVTLFMVFRSRRFIEYFPAFALLFAAVTWGRPGISYQIATVSKRWRQLRLLPLAALALIMIVTTGAQVYRDARNATNVSFFAGASQWLADHTEAGTPVFQTDWDDFTRLFYYNTRNTYLIGLDPTYLQLANPGLWTQWVALTRGQISQPSRLIRDTFGADYVISDTQHEGFINQTKNDPNMELVYRDESSMVWRIKSAAPLGTTSEVQ
ncbi:MAG: hypothetical protein K8I60_17320 [Anaerolineae bacterium]|nr:hypothetical protein [Anaerolineae bacterium]